MTAVSIGILPPLPCFARQEAQRVIGTWKLFQETFVAFPPALWRCTSLYNSNWTAWSASASLHHQQREVGSTDSVI
jgi:hypothetical protein